MVSLGIVIVFLPDRVLLQVRVEFLQLLEEVAVHDLAPAQRLLLALVVLPPDEQGELQAELDEVGVLLPELSVVEGTHGQQQVRIDPFSSPVQDAALASELQERQDVDHRLHFYFGILDHDRGDLHLGRMHHVADAPDGGEAIHFGADAAAPLVLSHHVGPVEFLEGVLGPSAAHNSPVGLQALHIVLHLFVKAAVVAFQTRHDEIILIIFSHEFTLAQVFHVQIQNMRRDGLSDTGAEGEVGVGLQLVLDERYYELGIVAMDADPIEGAIDGRQHLVDQLVSGRVELLQNRVVSGAGEQLSSRQHRRVYLRAHG